MKKPAAFKGNKSTLATKPCRVCLRDMTWRKAWAKNWHAVLYCSNACRLKAKANPKLEKTTEHLHGL
jgi:hypothetical protein